MPFDELGVALGIGLIAVGAITVLSTAATTPEPEPAVKASPMAAVDDSLRALAAAR